VRYAIALDVGGTKIEGVLFNERYRQVRKERVYYDKESHRASVNIPRKKLLATFDDLITRLKKGHRITGIGISTPGVVSPEGKIDAGTKVKAFRSFNIAKYFSKKHKTTCIVKNDADCFALGEQARGAGKGFKNVIGVIYGTGIGAGIIINGLPYSGSHGSAGEFGHNVLDPNGPQCRCGLKGDVEAFAAGPYLIRHYRKAGGKMKDPDPRKIYFSKEKAAKRVMAESLEMFAIGLASLVNIFDPDRIILGGGLSNLPIYSKLNRLVKRYAKVGLKQHVRIVKNKLGDSAGIYGAAALAFKH
jgi:fructokinase